MAALDARMKNRNAGLAKRNDLLDALIDGKIPALSALHIIKAFSV